MELWLVDQEEGPVGAGWAQVRRFGAGTADLPQVEDRDGEQWIWAPLGMHAAALARGWLRTAPKTARTVVTHDRALAETARAAGARVLTPAQWRQHPSSPLPDRATESGA